MTGHALRVNPPPTQRAGPVAVAPAPGPALNSATSAPRQAVGRPALIAAAALHVARDAMLLLLQPRPVSHGPFLVGEWRSTA